MPRYDLEDDDLSDLISYLKSLRSSSAPGVTATELYLATVVTDGVPEARRRALVDFLQSYAASKNGGTREELRRAQHAPFYVNRHYPAYRRWELRVWELHGEPAGWADQLELAYAQQPVFAVIAGIGSDSWQPIHDFCERNSIPCLYPTTDLPVTRSRTPTTCISPTACRWMHGSSPHNLRTAPKAPPRRVVQVVEAGDPEAQLAADVLEAALSAAGQASVRRSAPAERIADALEGAVDAEQTTSRCGRLEHARPVAAARAGPHGAPGYRAAVRVR
jgi:hypothetical protein